MKVVITAQMRNGILWEAVKQMGSQSALARHLDVAPYLVGEWLNFKSFAKFTRADRQQRREEIEGKLLLLTGHTLDEIFPPELCRNADFLGRKKRIETTLDMPVEQLIAAGGMPQLPPSPYEVVLETEMKDVLASTLATLTPREEMVIKLRFGLDGREEHTLEEIGERFHVGRERIRQIEKKALRKLRSRTRSRQLKTVF